MPVKTKKELEEARRFLAVGWKRLARKNSILLILRDRRLEDKKREIEELKQLIENENYYREIIDLILPIALGDDFTTEVKWKLCYALANKRSLIEFATDSSSSSSIVNEKGVYSVILQDAGPARIGVIKVLRSLRILSLRDANDLTKVPGNTLLRCGSKEEAEDFADSLREAGAIVRVARG